MSLIKRIARNGLRILGVEDQVVGPYRRLRAFFFRRKYGDITRFELQIDTTKVIFSTEDYRSKYWIFPRLENGKIYEEPVTRLLMRRLQSAKCFADVGTFVGYYSCIACKTMLHGSIYAFEMDSQNYALLMKNVELNGCANIQAFNVAVMDVPGPVSYYADEDRLSAGWGVSNDVAAGREGLTSVSAISLDAFFAQRDELPDVVKIDVEGAEAKVLSGMSHILKTKPPDLFIEIHPDKLPGFQSSLGEIISMLVNLGYNLDEIVGMRGRGKRVRLKSLKPGSNLERNSIICAHVSPLTVDLD